MRIALAGRPGSGKSALFELLARRAGGTHGGAVESSRGGGRVTHVEVPDPRLHELTIAYRPRKTTAARIEFHDLDQKGGPAYPVLSPERRDFLGRDDLILLVCDLFTGSASGWRGEAELQWRAALDEFILGDLAVVEGRLERVEKVVRAGQKPMFPGEPELLRKVRDALEQGIPVRDLPLRPEEERGLRGFALLSAKPVVPAWNLSEDGVADAPAALEGYGLPAGVVFSAEVEQQILQLPELEQPAFLAAYGWSEPATLRVVRAAYERVGLQTFFTVGEDEVRAWSIRRGTLAPGAAGVIHSDLEKGFVRAEVLAYRDWLLHGSHANAREKGAVRLEGREYIIQDGDIVEFRSGLARARG